MDIVGRWAPGQRLLTVSVDGRLRTVQVRRVGRNWELQTRGASHNVQVLSPHVADLAKHMIDKPPPDLSRLLLAPMPGLLTKLDVAVGDKVEPGQPVAVMEAMAAGLPVVATAVGGVPEIVGDAAILVPPRDVQAMSEALRALAADPNRRIQLGERARFRAAQFDIRCMIDAYAALFQKVTQR